MEERKDRCRVCNEWKPLSAFTRSNGYRQRRCKACHSNYVKQKRKSGEYQGSMKYSLKKRYNMTIADFEELLESQEHKCAICKTDLKTLSTKLVHIDHSHETNEVRGVLCHWCNVGLGSFKDDVDRLKEAINYLSKD